jgi:predicted ATPase
MTVSCPCDRSHAPRLVVVTGGPGAGKTALLEVVQNTFCRHVLVLPEAASILWRGGFPRRDSTSARCAAQRAIVRIQIELQRIAIEDGHAAMIVCDRGTLDGLAYWPRDAANYFDELETTHERELARYAAVIHLQPPTRADGYTVTKLRPESAEQAADIDERLTAAWAGHPRTIVIPSNGNFVAKLERGIAVLRAEIPSCCR